MVDDPTAELTGSDTATVFAGPAPEPVIERQVGRYVVLERVGQGGMGLVLRAYDPKLRREIALKLVKTRTAFGSDEAQARMLREAQALARLSHTNVTAVYDADVTDLGMFIAMEYVEGPTLRAWLKEEVRPWSTVLEAVLDAARGLAAAHAAGIVHRDVKPANILVGNDGRVRLTDFGLARERSVQEPSQGPEADVERPSAADSLADLTHVGTLLGTPPYLAPELHENASADTRSDQFALCVTLWEALYGERPFRGSTPTDLEAVKRKGPPPRPSSTVPDWAYAAVARGLAVDPDNRWPSIDALVGAFASGRARARRRRWVLGATAMGAACLAAVGYWRWERGARIDACDAEGESIADVWNDGAAKTMRTALIGTGVAHAEATAERVTPWLDEHAAQWARLRTQACRAAEVDRVWDRDMLDRSIWCLDAARKDFAAVVAKLSTGATPTVHEAVPAAAALPTIDACLDTETLARLPAPPTENRAAIEALRTRLSEAFALERTGEFIEGLQLAQAVAEDAEVLGWAPLTARAHTRVVRLLQLNGKYAEAQTLAEDTYFEAVECGALEVALETAERLVYIVGFVQRKRDEGLRWARHADLVRMRLPDPSGMLEARALGGRGAVHEAAGEYGQARELQARALESYERELGGQHPFVALALTNLGRTLRSLGEYGGAQAQLERALAIQEEVLGPEHPDLGLILNNLANVHTSAQAPERAQPLLERAIRIQEAALGLDHPEVAMAINNLANHYANAGRNEDATRMYRRTLRILEKVLGPEHPDVATTLNNIALTLGDPAEAQALHQRALAIREKALGPDHPDVAQSLFNLSLLEEAGGEIDEARRMAERALAIREAAMGLEHPKLADTLVALGRIALADGRRDDALASAERALRILQAAELDAREALDLLERLRRPAAP